MFKTGTEALHGVAWSTDYNDKGNVVTANGTVFPQAVGLASTWDPALIKQVGSAVGDEARGFNAQNPAVWGLNLWAPVVNLLRDPRWGRNEEGYSEDPTLTGSISTAYGSGMEGNDPRHLKTAPTLKHYLAYNNEVRRDVTSSNVPARVLNEYDRQAFKPAIAANAATGVMASYNLVNGRPATVSPDLNDVVRSWTNKPLFNVSDAYAPYNLTGSEAYFATQAEADAAVVKAGLNSFTVDGSDNKPTSDAIKSALAQGLLTEKDIDTAVGQALSIRFRLGEFDPDGGPYAKITAGRDQQPGAPEAGPADRRRGDGAAEERRPRPAARPGQDQEGGRRRPAGEHAVHRLVQRQPALQGHSAAGDQGAARLRRDRDRQRRRGPDRAQGRDDRQVRHRDRDDRRQPGHRDRRLGLHRRPVRRRSTGARAC